VSREVMVGLAAAAWLLVIVAFVFRALSGDWALFVFLALTVPVAMAVYVLVRRRMLRAR
jgi:predicted permease